VCTQLLVPCLTAAASLLPQVGLHPETGEPILANISRFGPYLQHSSLTVSLPKGCGGPLDVTLEAALAAVAAKEARMRARGRDPYEVRVCAAGP
jgi:DNA topoisomerase-1